MFLVFFLTFWHLWLPSFSKWWPFALFKCSFFAGFSSKFQEKAHIKWTMYTRNEWPVGTVTQIWKVLLPAKVYYKITIEVFLAVTAFYLLFMQQLCMHFIIWKFCWLFNLKCHCFQNIYHILPTGSLGFMVLPLNSQRHLLIQPLHREISPTIWALRNDQLVHLWNCVKSLHCTGPITISYRQQRLCRSNWSPQGEPLLGQHIYVAFS